MVRKHWKDTIMFDYNGQLPSINTIQNTILSIEDDLTRIFCILSYLTGGRISEIVNYSQEPYIRKAKRNKKGQTIKDEAGKTKYKWIKRKNKELKTAKGIMKKNIKVEDFEVKDELTGTIQKLNGIRIIMRNEKNKQEHTKIILAPILFENKLVENLFSYLNNLNPDEVVINIDRRRMYYNFIKHAKDLYYPHFIRALRVGVLLEYYDLKEYQVKELMGWTDLRPLNAYHIFKKEKGILRHFIKKVKEVSN